jgi:hypothetical protein
MNSRYVSWETPDGQLLRFLTRTDDGAAKMTTRGEARGDSLSLTTGAAGNPTETSIPWDPSYGGFFATEQQLERNPMQPGEQRSIKTLMPVINAVADIELQAADYEITDLLESPAELLRINAKTRQAGNIIESIIWTDKQGETQKTSVPAMNMVIYRTTKEIALQEGSPEKFDLGFDMVVRVAPPIANPHETQRIVYRGRLETGDPTSVFYSGGTQRVRRVDANTAEITVRALRPDTPLDEFPEEEPPTESELASSSYIQTEDERVIAMAEAAADDQGDTWAIARQLERYVHQTIRTKSFSRALATAAEVAVNREGDCTEHAVLLAAVCRIRRIPARVAIGLVYSPSVQGFAYHMWTEAWIDDRWIPLDATLGEGGIGAGHLKICHSSLEGTSDLGAFLPVLNLMGKLELEVLPENAAAKSPQPFQ